MSTYHQQESDGSFELYDKNSSKALGTIRTNDNSASPPGGPTFHQPTNLQQTKQIDQLTLELHRSRQNVLELQTKLQHAHNPNTYLMDNDDDFKDNRIRHLEREVTVLQAGLQKKHKQEQRMMELTQANNELNDRLHAMTTEINNLLAQKRQLEMKVKAQKDSIDRLTREKDFSSLRKGDNLDTSTHPQSTTSSLSPPGSAASLQQSVISEGSYSQELEHLHAMVDMLRTTVMDQRSIFLKMGLPGRMSSSASLQPASSRYPNTTYIAQPTSNQNASFSGTRISSSLPNGTSSHTPLVLHNRQGEESSEKPSTMAMIHQQPPFRSNPSVINNYLVTDIDLSDKEKIQKRTGSPQIAAVSKLNLKTEVEHPGQTAMKGGSNSINLGSNVLSDGSGHRNVPTSHHAFPHNSRMKDSSAVSVGGNVNTSKGVATPYQNLVSAASGLTINDGTTIFSQGVNLTSKSDMNSGHDVGKYSSLELVYENVDLSDNRDNDMFEDALLESNPSIDDISDNVEFNGKRPTPYVCNPTTIPISPKVMQKEPYIRRPSQTEVIGRQSSLIDPSELPHKCVTEIVGQGRRNYIQQQLHANQKQTETREDNFQIQYPPDVPPMSPTNLVAFPNSEMKTTAAMGQTHQRYLPNNGMNAAPRPSHPQPLPVSVSASFSDSNTLSNISDVTSSYTPYVINGNAGGPILTSQLQQQRHQQQQRQMLPEQQQQRHQQQHGQILPENQQQQRQMLPDQQQRHHQQQHDGQMLPDQQLRDSSPNNRNENNRSCPVCHLNLSDLSMDDFQAHVYDCFENENGPETLQATEDMNESVNPRQLLGKTCPMCHKQFHLNVSQQEFEAHVHRHFGDESFEMVAQ